MWNEKRLQQLKKDGKIKNFHLPEKYSRNMPKNISATRSKEKEWLAWNLGYWANKHAAELVEEFRFDDVRKWRFDYCFPALKIGIEYEGIFSDKSRHTTAKGFTGDTDKYNRAQVLGWRVIRITAINYKTVLTTLNEYRDIKC